MRHNTRTERDFFCPGNVSALSVGAQHCPMHALPGSHRRAVEASRGQHAVSQKTARRRLIQALLAAAGFDPGVGYATILFYLHQQDECPSATRSPGARSPGAQITEFIGIDFAPSRLGRRPRYPPLSRHRSARRLKARPRGPSRWALEAAPGTWPWRAASGRAPAGADRWRVGGRARARARVSRRAAPHGFQRRMQQPGQHPPQPCAD